MPIGTYYTSLDMCDTKTGTGKSCPFLDIQLPSLQINIVKLYFSFICKTNLYYTTFLYEIRWICSRLSGIAIIYTRALRLLENDKYVTRHFLMDWNIPQPLSTKIRIGVVSSQFLLSHLYIQLQKIVKVQKIIFWF